MQSSKKVQTITQWVTAFNTFVAIYVERVPQDAPKLMKYYEVVRDIAFKSGEWLFYDEQFRFLRQSAPEQHPWDQIHWELWLRAMVNSRGKIPQPMTIDPVLVHAPFPRVFVGHFIPEKPVVAAITSISAANVGQNSPLVTVPRPGTTRATDPLN